VGGLFDTLGGVNRGPLGRLLPGGAYDTTFDSGIASSFFDKFVAALALQSDGRILAGGDFAMVHGQSRDRLARFEPNGDLDESFDTPVDSFVNAIALLEDGKIAIGGVFDNVDMQPRQRFARLSNGAAVSRLDSAGAGTSVVWTREGTIPEVDRVSFELSDDDGMSWQDLGPATRDEAGDWVVGDLLLPSQTTMLIRATALSAADGAFHGGNFIFESLSQIFLESAFVDRLPQIAALEAQIAALDSQIIAAQRQVSKAKKKVKRSKTVKNKKRFAAAKRTLNLLISRRGTFAAQLAALRQV
jgi:hypothetical protein